MRLAVLPTCVSAPGRARPEAVRRVWRACVRIAGMILAAALLAAGADPSGAAFDAGGGGTARIGVLAENGAERCHEDWDATAAYLSATVPGWRFEIIPLGFDDVCGAVERHEIEFILANSSFYVDLEMLHGANRVATLKNLRLGQTCTQFAGVIFCRADNPDLLELDDLAGCRFMAVEEDALGGWQAAWRELVRCGIDPRRDFAALEFSGTREAVVHAVRQGRADAGTVRSDTLERLAAEGLITLADFRILHQQHAAAVPFLHSTDCYPEWPMAVARHTAPDLAEAVASALLSMPAESAAARAAHCAGWTIPLNYQPVHDCLKELRIGPYADFGRVGLQAVLRQYRPWILALTLAAALILLFALRVARLNRRLGESSAYLQTVIDAIPDPLLAIDRQHRLRLANSAGLAAAQRAGEDRVLTCHQASHGRAEPCAGGEHPCPLQAVVESRAPVVIEHVHEDREKGPRRVEITAAPIFDKDGTIREIIEFSRDVTARVLAEQEVREREETLRTMADSAQEAIIMMDPEGRISFWNRAAEAAFGWPAAEAKGRVLHELIAPAAFHQAYSRGFQAFRQTGRGAAVGKTLELSALHRDGREFPVEVSLSAVNLRGAWHAIGSVRDITQRKRAEADLVKARDEAESAARAKAAFLANMSHEIRTPMNAVIGMTGLLLGTSLDAEQRDCVETVRTAGDSLLSLINDILDFSKIESGKLDIEEIEFDLRWVVESVAELLAPRAQEKGLELTCCIEPATEERLIGDPERVRQILVNLAGNAVKFTERGNVDLAVRRASRSGNGVVLRFSVADSGIGIPADRQQAIFEKFTQADGSTTRRYGGSGLGLSISRSLVELMHGQIGVDSAPGKGSTFWLTLPFAVPECAPPAAARAEDERPLQGARVLVVDDNAINRRILMQSLAARGCALEEAADGPAGLRLLAEAADAGRPCDALLLDYPTPDMDGEEMLRALRADARHARLQVLLLTSAGDRGAAARFAALGCAACLTKPVRLAALLEALGNALARRDGKSLAGARAGGAAAGEPERRRASGLRILLAEDNPVNQKVTLRILERFGHRADAVGNGLEALAALDAAPYDLVLMDMQMPEMDGYTAAAAIRAAEGTARRTPIIAMTAHALKGDRERCLAAGMDDYVSKPLRPDDLLDVIDRWADGKALAPR
ncbi:MAG: response regulator [Planctomycetes bacterium]|nr:response regulator [Planctomycetota bacterium]